MTFAEKCARCGQYLCQEAIKAESHFCLRCWRERRDAQEVADDDRAHAEMDRRAGL